MYYNVLDPKKLVHLDNETFDKKVLLENGEGCLKIIALKKNEIIDTHTSTNDAAVYVLDGKIARGNKACIYRGDKKIFEGEIATIQREKNEAKEVDAKLGEGTLSTDEYTVDVNADSAKAFCWDKTTFYPYLEAVKITK